MNKLWYNLLSINLTSLKESTKNKSEKNYKVLFEINIIELLEFEW